MMAEALQKNSGRVILMYFVGFFAVIIVVNSIFIYSALSTHSGVVTEQPYKKGLAFNETLAKAKAQPALEHEVFYDDGVLRWKLPVENASVTASIVRPVQEGHDFNIALKHTGSGVYEVKTELPLHGVWTANLKATWDNQQFQTTHDFIAR